MNLPLWAIVCSVIVSSLTVALAAENVSNLNISIYKNSIDFHIVQSINLIIHHDKDNVSHSACLSIEKSTELPH